MHEPASLGRRDPLSSAQFLEFLPEPALVPLPSLLLHHV